MSWAEVCARLDGRRGLKRTVFTVSGTGVDMWTGYPAEVAEAISEQTPYYYFQPVNYPANMFPMGASVDEGVAELERLLTATSGEWVGIYYSQGGIVGSLVHKRMAAGQSPVAHRLADCKGIVTYGNPCRQVGTANGNKRYGWPMPAANTRGIAPKHQRLHGTPNWWLDFVNPGDIYAEVANNDVGEDMTMIYRIVQNPANLITGPDNLIEQIGELLVSPLREIPAAIGAIWNGLTFVAGQPWPTYPHTSYDIGPGIDYLTYVGDQVPVINERAAA